MQRRPSRRKSAVVLLFLLAVLTGTVYTLHKPTLQVYWAIYARIYPGKEASAEVSAPDQVLTGHGPAEPDPGQPDLPDKVEKEQQKAKAAALPAIKAEAEQLGERPERQDQAPLNTNAKMAAEGDAQPDSKLPGEVQTMADGSSSKQDVVLTAAKPAAEDLEIGKAGAAAVDSVMDQEVEQVTHAKLAAGMGGPDELERPSWHPKAARKHKSLAANKGQAAKDAMLSTAAAAAGAADGTGAAHKPLAKDNESGAAADQQSTQSGKPAARDSTAVGTGAGQQSALRLPSDKMPGSSDSSGLHVPTDRPPVRSDSIGVAADIVPASGTADPGASTKLGAAAERSIPQQDQAAPDPLLVDSIPTAASQAAKAAAAASQAAAADAAAAKPQDERFSTTTTAATADKAEAAAAAAAAEAAGKAAASSTQPAAAAEHAAKGAEGGKGSESGMSADVASMAAVLLAHDVDVGVDEAPGSKVGGDAPQPKAQAAGNLPQGWTGNAEDYKLTSELVGRYAEDKVVMVTWANFHYRDFVLNWVEHVEGCGVSAYLVGAMDDQLLELLVEKGVHAFGMQSGLSLDDFGWGSKTFHKMGREKIRLIHTFNKMGFDILVSDVDTVWLQDPLPYVARASEADILTSSDHLANTVDDDSLEQWPQAGSAANIGIMLFRTTAAALAEEWNQVLEADANVWDQNAFNDLFRRGASAEGDRPDNLFKGYDGKLLIGILPVSIFCSGHTYFVQRLPERLQLKPYVVHATFQYSGTPGKRHRLRERLLWNDPPAYFDPPGGLLTFDLDLTNLLEGSTPQPRDGTLPRTLGHFKLVNHQLVQIRNAMAIAQTLGRTLVVPELWCGQDRWWAPHDGIIPGSKLELPYRCPMDHVFDLEQMARSMPAAEFGPDISYREFSFMNNTRLPATIAKSKLQVNICAAADASCSDGSSAAAEVTPGVVHLRPLLQDEQLLTALKQAAAGVKVVHFNTMYNAFVGFANGADGVKFEKRTKQYTSIWCCVNAHPGHVWYDMWWDVQPHTDRHNRIIRGPWQPITGP
ncbi:hypothetical protein WJX72_010080 [[Myrmecia] bisecta]|uniref:Nucleotide-diphospho-sugar transferase domain-containing protein n=1 Tax=[Myrmecia] bisecta TaxID=41462 RepID=A0AAW1PUH2_9CHLO